MPMTGIEAVGFNGKKSDKLKLQIFPEIMLNSIAVNLNIIIVPNLIKECILGIDSLVLLEDIIHIKNNLIHITNNNKKDKLNFAFKNLNSQDVNIVNAINSCLAHKLNTSDMETEKIHTSKNMPSQRDIEERMKKTHNLDQQQRLKLQSLLVKYRDVFANCPGKIEEFEYEFKIKDNSLFMKKPYPIPLKYTDTMRDIKDQMLKEDIIEPSNSTCINPLAISIKKDGTL